jgi:hypothetical protein
LLDVIALATTHDARSSAPFRPKIGQFPVTLQLAFTILPGEQWLVHVDAPPLHFEHHASHEIRWMRASGLSRSGTSGCPRWTQSL